MRFLLGPSERTFLALSNEPKLGCPSSKGHEVRLRGGEVAQRGGGGGGFVGSSGGVRGLGRGGGRFRGVLRGGGEVGGGVLVRGWGLGVENRG